MCALMGSVLSNHVLLKIWGIRGDCEWFAITVRDFTFAEWTPGTTHKHTLPVYVFGLPIRERVPVDCPIESTAGQLEVDVFPPLRAEMWV